VNIGGKKSGVRDDPEDDPADAVVTDKNGYPRKKPRGGAARL
jgi:hypothetical protein